MNKTTQEILDDIEGPHTLEEIKVALEFAKENLSSLSSTQVEKIREFIKKLRLQNFESTKELIRETIRNGGPKIH